MFKNYRINIFLICLIFLFLVNLEFSFAWEKTADGYRDYENVLTLINITPASLEEELPEENRAPADLNEDSLTENVILAGVGGVSEESRSYSRAESSEAAESSSMDTESQPLSEPGFLLTLGFKTEEYFKSDRLLQFMNAVRQVLPDTTEATRSIRTQKGQFEQVTVFQALGKAFSNQQNLFKILNAIESMNMKSIPIYNAIKQNTLLIYLQSYSQNLKTNARFQDARASTSLRDNNDVGGRKSSSDGNKRRGREDDLELEAEDQGEVVGSFKKIRMQHAGFKEGEQDEKEQDSGLRRSIPMVRLISDKPDEVTLTFAPGGRSIRVSVSTTPKSQNSTPKSSKSGGEQSVPVITHRDAALKSVPTAPTAPFMNKRGIRQMERALDGLNPDADVFTFDVGRRGSAPLDAAETKVDLSDHEDNGSIEVSSQSIENSDDES